MIYTTEQIETARMLIRFYNLQAGTSFRISYDKKQAGNARHRNQMSFMRREKLFDDRRSE